MKISFIVPKYNTCHKAPNEVLSSGIHFKGEQERKEYHTYPNINLPQKVSRPSTRESTLEKFNNVYAKYKSSLVEISENEIDSTINSLCQKTGYPQEHITQTMQGLTQFGSIGSVISIGKELEKYNIATIAKGENPTNVNAEYDKTSNFGLNNTLKYLIKKKKMGILSEESEFNAIFLDNNKLAQYEALKEKAPEQLKKIVTDKNNHFFILSGFNNGVNFLNISSEILETKTKDALWLKDIDQVSKERSKALGIEPIVIENKKDSIYEQLKPVQMSPKEMMALIDANLMTLHNDPKTRIDVKDDIVQYLDNSLEVYTPSKLSKELKEIHSKIEKIVTARNMTMDDVAYVIPFPEKSYDYINYQYQLVNNIPAEKFVEIPKHEDLPKIDNKILVIIDDSNISGNSMRLVLPSMYYSLQKNNDYKSASLIVAPVYSTEFASMDMEYLFDEFLRNKKDVMIKQNPIKKPWNNKVKDDEALIKSLGEQFFEGELRNEYPCIVFPYMSPDNNSELASDIALFHSPIYRDNPTTPIRNLRSSIKSYSEDAENVARLTEELLKQD